MRSGSPFMGLELDGPTPNLSAGGTDEEIVFTFRHYHALIRRVILLVLVAGALPRRKG